MVERSRLRSNVVTGGGAYFAAPQSHHTFISSGCQLLNCALGGGWVLGRVANIVGDKSTGKTLLAIEAAAEFAAKFPKGMIFYRESEAAFDEPYAEALGLPLDRVEFWDKEKEQRAFDTVECWYEDIEKQIARLMKRNQPGLYILDSLDALSDAAELERDIDEGSYGMSKPKLMGQAFRRVIQKIEASKMCLIIISQVRTAIGQSFGDKTTRSGGRALDFYATHILYLRHIELLKKKVNGLERPIGIQVRARCKKNKVGLPFREAEFDVIFGYGIDDLAASLEWLREVKRTSAVGVSDPKDMAAFLRSIEELPDLEYKAKIDEISEAVSRVWSDIETSFLPTRRKPR